jgi:hypothetical protein
MESKNKEFRKFIYRNDYVAIIFFYLIIFIQALLFTSFSTFLPQISTIMAKAEKILIFLYVFYALMVRITMRKLVYFLGISILAMLMFLNSGTFSVFIKLLLLTMAVPATIPSSKKITKIFAGSLLTTMLVSIGLSLIGTLPRSGATSRSITSNYQETVYFLGFNHPNAFGTFLTMLFAILIFLLYKKYKWQMIAIAPIFFILDVKIGAGTAAIGILILFCFMILPIKINGFYKIFFLLPSALTLFALWLSYNNLNQIATIINQNISSRPNVWNAYVVQYPINFINTPPQIDTSGYFGILGNGVLDGSYIYILIFWGILAWLVYNFIFISIINFSLYNKDKILFGVAILTIIMAFPESHMIMFYENVFLLFVGFYQYSFEERKECLSL